MDIVGKNNNILVLTTREQQILGVQQLSFKVTIPLDLQKEITWNCLETQGSLTHEYMSARRRAEMHVHLTFGDIVNVLEILRLHDTKFPVKRREMFPDAPRGSKAKITFLDACLAHNRELLEVFSEDFASFQLSAERAVKNLEERYIEQAVRKGIFDTVRTEAKAHRQLAMDMFDNAISGWDGTTVSQYQAAVVALFESYDWSWEKFKRAHYSEECAFNFFSPKNENDLRIYFLEQVCFKLKSAKLSAEFAQDYLLREIKNLGKLRTVGVAEFSYPTARENLVQLAVHLDSEFNKLTERVDDVSLESEVITLLTKKYHHKDGEQSFEITFHLKGEEPLQWRCLEDPDLKYKIEFQREAEFYQAVGEYRFCEALSIWEEAHGF